LLCLTEPLPLCMDRRGRVGKLKVGGISVNHDRIPLHVGRYLKLAPSPCFLSLSVLSFAHSSPLLGNLLSSHSLTFLFYYSLFHFIHRRLK
jgi:hypothetical protein